MKGRVRQLEILDNPAETFVAGLEFDQVTWPGHSDAFLANLVDAQQIQGMETALFTGKTETSNTAGGVFSTATTEKLRLVPIPGVARFFLQGQRVVIPKGFRMTWKTEPVKNRD